MEQTAAASLTDCIRKALAGQEDLGPSPSPTFSRRWGGGGQDSVGCTSSPSLTCLYLASFAARASFTRTARDSHLQCQMSTTGVTLSLLSFSDYREGVGAKPRASGAHLTEERQKAERIGR